MAKVGRPMKMTVEEMEECWEAYKERCDNRTVKQTKFMGSVGRFVTDDVPASVTYTIKGFALWIGLSESTFYQIYAGEEHPEFSELISRIRDEVEQDAREKFELGVIPSQLSGLWMSRYGYSTKSETDVKGGVPVVISGENDLED